MKIFNSATPEDLRTDVLRYLEWKRQGAKSAEAKRLFTEALVDLASAHLVDTSKPLPLRPPTVSAYTRRVRREQVIQ
jgi:hypothetical protein